MNTFKINSCQYFWLLSIFILASCQGFQDNDQKSEPIEARLENSDTTKYRLMTWNIEHFVDMHDSPYIDNSKENAPSSDMPERYELLAQALRKIDADIVVFQEVESAQLVKWLADSLLPEFEYKYFDDHESIDWYMNVVIMSKIPLGIFYGLGNISTEAAYIDDQGAEQKETQSFLNTRMIMSDIYFTNSQDLLLTGLHLKAGGGNRNAAIRKSQMLMLKEQLEKIGLQKAMIITGDLNAYPDSEELNILKATGEPTFKDVLPMEALSHPADSPFRRLDYILVNNAFEEQYKVDTVFIPYLFEVAQQSFLSDHLPVVMDFHSL